MTKQELERLSRKDQINNKRLYKKDIANYVVQEYGGRDFLYYKPEPNKNELIESYNG